ncbi:retropepsin-like aspartic protease [Bradyrhizobium sp. LTSPM299]|uniref:retropepsin-like aspartic protease n=1 Tax=Bradyrhizobium sp. LTSPM299 TaxID=1619233 RepID=UPI0018CE01BC|nr:retropepsin-like aspartic protease [Bradyrhizobium sp. LTSPM299]
MDTYSVVFLALAIFFFLVRSVLRQRTGSERPPVTDAFLYRLSMISAVLAAVLYVANRTQLHSLLEAVSTPVATPTVAAPKIAAPAIAAITQPAPVVDSVPIYPTNNGASAMIDVVLGVQPLRMLLDTGATTCLVSEAIAARIVRDGYGVRQEAARFKMADGTIRSLPTLLIREVQIGQHTVRNVWAGVSPTGEMLLAFPVVNAIAPFTIDTRARLLIFHTSSNSIGGGHFAASPTAGKRNDPSKLPA